MKKIISALLAPVRSATTSRVPRDFLARGAPLRRPAALAARLGLASAVLLAQIPSPVAAAVKEVSSPGGASVRSIGPLSFTSFSLPAGGMDNSAWVDWVDSTRGAGRGTRGKGSTSSPQVPAASMAAGIAPMSDISYQDARGVPSSPAGTFSLAPTFSLDERGGVRRDNAPGAARAEHDLARGARVRTGSFVGAGREAFDAGRTSQESAVAEHSSESLASNLREFWDRSKIHESGPELPAVSHGITWPTVRSADGGELRAAPGPSSQPGLGRINSSRGPPVQIEGLSREAAAVDHGPQRLPARVAVKVGLAGLAIVGASLAFAHPAAAASLLTAHAGFFNLFHWSQIAKASYQIGNIVSFGIALPQIYKTFSVPHAQVTPEKAKKEAKTMKLLIAASLLPGVVNSPLSHNVFWGMQNIFGGMTAAAPLLLAHVWKDSDKLVVVYEPPRLPEVGADSTWIQRAFRRPARSAYRALHWLRYSGALHRTLQIAAVALLLSAALYSTAGLGLAWLLKSSLSPAALHLLTSGVQVVAGLLFLWIVWPVAAAVWRNEPPENFTPGFALVLALSSICFAVWAGYESVFPSPSSSVGRGMYVVYAVQNAVYAVLAGLGYHFLRRAPKSGSRGPR